MTNFDIKINIRKISNYSGLSNNRRTRKTLLLMIESFSQYVLELYGRLIEEAIYSRRYKGNWEPVEEEGYREYLGIKPTRNILYSIRESLEVKKIGYHFIVRFNPSYRYPGTKIPFIRVLRAIENGTSDFNARPIISKIVVQLRSNLLDLWRGYLTMKGVI